MHAYNIELSRIEQVTEKNELNWVMLKLAANGCYYVDPNRGALHFNIGKLWPFPNVENYRGQRQARSSYIIIPGDAINTVNPTGYS